MKKLTEKIMDFSSNAWGEIEYSLRMLCGKPRPAKRLVMALIAVGTPAVVYIYFVVSSIYNMGVNSSALRGDAPALRGDAPAVRGDVSAICGDVSAIHGDVSAVHVDVSALCGDAPCGRRELH